MSSEAELAWAAGLFEGEGCVYEARVRRQIYMGLSVEMCDEDVLLHFAEVMRSHGLTTKAAVTSRWRGNVKHRRQYAFRLGGKKAVDAYLLMRPWLASRRQQRGDELIAAHQQRVDELTAERECIVCGSVFRPVNVWAHKVQLCSARCKYQHKMSKPGVREAARERSRRHKAKLRAQAM